MNAILIPVVALAALATAVTDIHPVAPLSDGRGAPAAHGQASPGAKPIIVAQTGCSSRGACR